MNERIIINTVRSGYAIDQIRNTMTVGKLIDFLSDYNEDVPVYLSFDNGYTYGGINERSIEAEYNNDEEEAEELS